MFVLKTAFKYMFSKKSGQRNNTVLTIIGISLSILAVLVVSSVMNGLQETQLERLRNIESFDLIIDNSVLSCEDIRQIDQVDEAFEFLETSVLITDKSNGKSIVTRMRAFDYATIKATKLGNSLFVVKDPESFKKSLSISYPLMNELSYSKNDSLNVTFLKKGKSATLSPKNQIIENVCSYSSSSGDFSSSTVLMDLENANSILGNQKTKIGVFVSGSLKNVIAAISEKDPSAEIIPWQKYNKVIYSALTLEKAMVYLFLAFMYIILCVNLKNSTSRLIDIKKTESAVLMAIGSDKRKILSIYLLQGVIITVLSEILGLILSFLFIRNIQTIFGFADNVSYFLTKNTVNLSSVAYFAEINKYEVVGVVISVFVLSFLFIVLGCKKLFKNQIMENVLNVSD